MREFELGKLFYILPLLINVLLQACPRSLPFTPFNSPRHALHERPEGSFQN